MRATDLRLDDDSDDLPHDEIASRRAQCPAAPAATAVDARTVADDAVHLDDEVWSLTAAEAEDTAAGTNARTTVDAGPRLPDATESNICTCKRMVRAPVHTARESTSGAKQTGGAP